jgi:hypothetical protein
MLDEERGRAIIDFAVDRLRDIFDAFEAKEVEVDKDEDGLKKGLHLFLEGTSP